MKRIMVVAMVGLLACSDEIDPDPTSGGGNANNGTGGNTTSAGASGEGGTGAHGEGAAAAGGGVPGGGFESGSRLKAQTLVGQDGSRSPTGWYDSEMGVACVFRKASDGQTRCLPNGPTIIYYSDDTCATPMVVATCAPGGHALLIEDSCTGAARVFPIGGSISPANAYVKVGASCTNVVDPAPPIYSVGAEIPASSFVGTTLETEP